LGYPVPEGNKYKNLALLVGGVSKIETINYAHESRGTHDLRKTAQAMPGKNWKYRPDFSAEREKLSKIIKEKMRKFGCESQVCA
jgi:hypothetical protein